MMKWTRKRLHTESLTSLYESFVSARPEDQRVSCAKMDRENFARIRTLSARGITMMSDLVEALPHLPSTLRDFGIWWISVVRFRAAEKTLLRLLYEDRKRRLAYAAALASVGGRQAEQVFVQLGRDHLASPTPDPEWLDTVIQGLKYPNHHDAGEILLSIFEAKALPGWLRGNAGDAMSSCSQLVDRRTKFFRRALTAASNGLFEDDIDVQFWSMFVIAKMAQSQSARPRHQNHEFASALPRLREIAASDHRLGPGFWWPMSAEAEDAICVIETGHWPIPDAGDRWHGNTERGPMKHI